MKNSQPKQVVCLGVFNPDGEMLWGVRKDNSSWTTIAGSMEGDESPTEAAIREAKEEGNLDLTEEDCQYIGCKHIKSGEMIVHVFKVKSPADYVPSCENDPDDEFVDNSLKFYDIKHGLPAKIANNLHIPEGHNVLLQLMPIEYLDLIKTEDAQLVAGLSAKPTGPKPVKAKVKPEPEKNLIVTHNLSEAGLHHAHELGGLAAPSIAIAHKDHPLSSFGEITLVGDHSLVDPKQGVPVFDADVYSPRHPRAKFALNEKKWTNFARDLREHAKLTGDSSFADQSIERDLADNGKLSDPRYVPHSQNALASLFLKEKGVAVPTQTRLKKIGRYPWVASQHIQGLRNSPALSTNIVFGSPEHKTLSEAVKRAVQNHKYTDTGTNDELNEKDNQITIERTLEHLFNEDGNLAYGPMDNIVSQAKKVGESEHDPDHYNEQVSKLIEPHKEDFNHWKTIKEKELVGERYIPKHVDSAYGPKTRKLPYTLSNIVKEVTRKPVRGGENFNYGLGSTRAVGAKKFRSVEDIQKDRHKVIDNKSFKAQREQLDNEFTDFLSANSLSSSPVLEAMGESYKKGKYLHRELKESGLDLQPHQVAKIAEFAHRLRNLPTEYFEAKPQRAVGLHEFKGAVVPHTASEHTKQLLRNMGLHVETYDSSDKATNDDGSNNQRRDAINKIAQMKALHLSDESQYKLETVTKTGIDSQPASFDEENWEDNDAPAEDLSKSLSDIPKGKKLTSTHWGPVHSYTHMLPPELVKDGYRLTVDTRDFGEPGEHGIGAKIWHKAKEAGMVSGMLHFKPSVAKVRFSSVDVPHRGKGLGKLAYEALLAHAKHLGIGKVKGDEHSTSASAVHQHLAQKHGMDYKPQASTVGDKQPGDFDSRFAPYEYVLKGENLNVLKEALRNAPEHQRSSITDWRDMDDNALTELVCEGLLDVDHVLLEGPSSYALETLANCPDKKISLPAKIVRGLGEDVDHVLLYDPKLVPWKYASYGFRNQYLSLAKDKLPHNVFDAACRYMKAVKPVSTRAAISVPGQLAKSFAPTTEQLLEWVVVNEPLSKSFKHQLMGLAAASILSGSAQAQPKDKDPIQMDQTKGFGATSGDAQTVHVPGKFEAKRNWTMQGLHPELVALAGNESAGGKLWDHATHSGGEFETAYGPLGMKPSTGLEHFVNDPTLRKVHPDIAPLSQHPLEMKKNPQVQAAFLKEFKTNPALYNTLAGKEWNRLKSVFNGNLGHAALGWRWGENGARKQIETGLAPESEKYVQDFHKHYGRVVNDRAIDIISKQPRGEQ